MAAPGFGFSFGDFVQAITIANDIRKALRDTGGAKDEFRHVSVDVQHLEILLEQLNNGSWDHGGDAGHLNAIKGMALTCKMPLQEFLVKVEKYKALKAEDLKGFRANVGNRGKKIQWAVKMKDEVEKFRAVVVSKVVAINLLIQMHTISKISEIDTRTKAMANASEAAHEHIRDSQAANIRAGTEIEEIKVAQTAAKESIGRLVLICTGTKVGVEDFRKLIKIQHAEIKLELSRLEQKQTQQLLVISSTSQEIVSFVSRLETMLKQLIRVFGGFSITALMLLRKILKTDMEIYALLHQIQGNFPRGPTQAIEDTFKFTDALGRTQHLQYQWFRHWDVFESMLKCEFRRLPGENRVRDGEYYILNARRKCLIISPSQWEQSVFPGSDVSMSIVIIGQLFKQGICPRQGCGTKNQLPSDGSTHVICSNCNLEYHCVGVLVPPEISNTQVISDVPSFDLPSHPRVVQEASTSQETDQDSSKSSFKKPRIAEDLDAFKAIHIQTPFESTSTRESKKKQSQDVVEQLHVAYIDELMDYFLLPPDEKFQPPEPPPNFQPEWPTDADGHTPLHWASSMCDVQVTKQLIELGADVSCRNIRGETPLMRSVVYTNCWDGRSMPEMVKLLSSTIFDVDFENKTVLHHAVQAAQTPTTSKRYRDQCGRYYLRRILQGAYRHRKVRDLQSLLDAQDSKGNTALQLAVQGDVQRCTKELEELNTLIGIKNEVSQWLLLLNTDQEESSDDEDESDNPDWEDEEVQEEPNKGQLSKGESLHGRNSRLDPHGLEIPDILRDPDLDPVLDQADEAANISNFDITTSSSYGLSLPEWGPISKTGKRTPSSQNKKKQKRRLKAAARLTANS